MSNNRLHQNNHSNRLEGPQAGSPMSGFMARVTGVAGAIVGVVVLASLVIFGFMVSLVVLPVVLVVALVAIGYFWFKTRTIRQELKAQVQALREQMPGQRPGGTGPIGRNQDNGTIIDGEEFIHETHRDDSRRAPPR